MTDLTPYIAPAIPEVQGDSLAPLFKKALLQIEEILDIDIESVDPENKMKMLSIKKDAAHSIINAGLKADENRFRRENKDIVERLFEKVRKESKLIDGVVVHRV